jgi:hypothetical protein
MCWRQGGFKKLKSQIADGTAALEALVPAYFAPWKVILATEFEAEIAEYELALCENPEYITALITFLYEHNGDHAASVAHLAPAGLAALLTEELAFIEKLQLAEEDVKNINWHLALKCSVDLLWRGCFYHPVDTTVYGLWDHMVGGQHFFKIKHVFLTERPK